MCFLLRGRFPLSCVPLPQQDAVPHCGWPGSYLSVGKAQHGLHHGRALPVLQRVEGAVVLQGGKVLLPPGGRHLSHHFSLHLCERREESPMSSAHSGSVSARNVRTGLFIHQNHFCDEENKT